MLVISQKIIKMINSSTKSHRYEEHLWYTRLTATLCRGIIGSRVTKWNVFYKTLVSCMMGVILTFNENKSFQRLGSHYDFGGEDLLLPCVVKIIKALKNNFKCFHCFFACHKSNFA